MQHFRRRCAYLAIWGDNGNFVVIYAATLNRRRPGSNDIVSSNPAIAAGPAFAAAVGSVSTRPRRALSSLGRRRTGTEMTPEAILAHAPRVLTQGQREEYFARGFLAAEGLIPNAWLEMLRRRSREFIEKS